MSLSGYAFPFHVSTFGAYKSLGAVGPSPRKLICLDPVGYACFFLCWTLDFNSETPIGFQVIGVVVLAVKKKIRGRVGLFSVVCIADGLYEN
ncbi:hypothetical protein MTR67_031077 [Solanum verrucosum]|uniref:Uncharacterized protein n=1 Tax=Solanum verrucosum TaxID=315347 RepID=A0AAF0U1U2_SOLVR|nr:hypothetical protein MTR67_031077 [Solanum verrucosum]